MTSLNTIFTGDIETNICSTFKIGCYKQAAEKLYGEDIVDGLDDADAKLFRRECNCLPSCTSLTYEVIDRIQTFGQTRVQKQTSMYQTIRIDSISFN